MSYQEDLKKIMIMYPDVEILSRSDYRDLINIHNILESAFAKEPNHELVKVAFKNRTNYKLNSVNDYYFLVFSTLGSQPLVKKGYYNDSENIEIQPEFDLTKWSKLVYKIYDAVESGDFKLSEAIDYYADTLNTEEQEDEKFKMWLKYYQSGENLKYKKAFQFPLNGPGFYPMENAIVPEAPLENFKKKVDIGNDYQDWKSKLYSAIRRIDKLLRLGDEFMDPEMQKELSELLHHFDQEVKTLRHQTTASDLAFNYATKFKKIGFNQGHQEFLKFAQENEKLTPKQEDDPSELLETPDEEETSQKQNQGPSPSGAKQGEYEKLNADVDLGDAVKKLEEIAGRLSDRRTIRLLAEFDIILDKIGIAAMFPELAEAQSKLIDGYSYALTRVTKMLGMLSSGRSLVEISDAKKKETTEKTMKEIGKSFNEENQGEEGNPAIQQGVEEQKQIQPNVPAAPEKNQPIPG